MAKMIPSELKDRDYISNGEKEVFDILKDGLSDEWVVIYSLRWATDSDIFIGRSNGESDFILIHKDYGIMILEIKGGIVRCINGEWSSVSDGNIKRSIKDPEKQANEAKFSLISRLKKDNLNPYITTAIWLPDCIKEKCNLPLSMPKEIVLDMSSFNNIEKTIIDIFNFRAEKEGFDINKLKESEYKKILDILNPKLEVKIPLLRLANKLNMQFIRLNDEQNNFFEQLDGNNFISVKGHAGTGKTILAVRKAYRESEGNKKVLFLCYNLLLRDRIKEESDKKFDVYAIYDLASEYLRKTNKPLFEDFENTGDYDIMMANFIKEINEKEVNQEMMYDSIVIDEGQDFREEWFNGVNKLLKNDGSICVFYDENQMLYNKYGRKDISFLDKGTKYILKRNMRNTDEICNTSLNVIKANKNNIKLNGVNGLEPDIIFIEDSFDTITQLKNIIIELKRNEYLKDENISVLTMEAKKKIKFKKGILDVFKGTVESIRRFKGLESDIVIIPDLNHNFMEDEDTKNLLYVGASRAKAHLILMINTEELTRKQRSEYKKEIREMLL